VSLSDDDREFIAEQVDKVARAISSLEETINMVDNSVRDLSAHVERISYK
jgi:hypothetical protein